MQRAGDPTFLSNVNACYARACWEQVGFRDVPYSEDQAFGADMLAAGWLKAYAPGAAVLHAHDYGPLEFMRRYFDEYRGLHESTGHVEPFGVGATARHVRNQVAGDRRWMSEQGLPAGARARWTARAAVHHGGRRVFSALGSRAEQVPPPLRRRLSLEGRDDAPASDAPIPDALAPGSSLPPPLPSATHVAPKRDHDDYAEVARVWREGVAPLLDPVPGHGRTRAPAHRDADSLLPAGQRRARHADADTYAAGAHGHVCSVWLYDFTGQHLSEWPAVVRADINEFFAPMQGPVYKDFSEWQGADVVIATGWQTVAPALLLDQCRARVYLVNDHETEFFPTSTERHLAEETYRRDLHCIAASPWLRDLLIERYGASADAFQLGVDHSIYAPLDEIARDPNTVVYYARHATPRRAVPIGLMALAELTAVARRRASCCSATRACWRARSLTSTMGCSRRLSWRAFTTRRPSGCACP